MYQKSERYTFNGLQIHILKMYHGNLTIRNILLADDHIVKIGDYGLEKKPYSHETHRQSKSVRWLQHLYLSIKNV